MASAVPTITKTPPSNPLIPEKYLDVPSQRLYYLSLGLLCQSIKVLDFVWSLASGEDRMATCRKWLLVDFGYCVLLSQLRIPRLQYSKASIILQIGLLWFLNGILFGGINVNAVGLLGGGVGFSSRFSDIPSTSDEFSIRDILAPMAFGLISSSINSRDTHLLGQHTVRMSPISTAHLNPQNLNFCISPSNKVAYIPLVLNNTNIAGLRYSLTPLGYLDNGSKGKIEVHDVNAKELKNYSETHATSANQPSATGVAADEYDEYDDDDEENTKAGSLLQQTQSMTYLSVSRPGILRLERVIDHSNVDARLVISEAVIVPCPQVEFAKDEGSAQEPIRCAGQEADTQLKINVQGVPPLSLRWIRTIDGNREQFLVEGIEGDHKDDSAHKEEIQTSEVIDSHSPSALSIVTRVPSPQHVTVPLTVSLENPGAYLYALEEITDGVGNTIRVGVETRPTDMNSVSKTKTTRSFVVLQKPAVSFGHCSSDTPARLLIGSDSTIDIRTQHVDEFDMPLDINVTYQPPTEGDQQGKNYQAWKKTLKLQAEQRNLGLPVNAPGDYKILGIKGKYCTGTVLAPDVCKVVQKPYPTAEIQWKRIHECSGDTGVSATLVMHGTPPFQIYYRMRRDDETVREISKTFTSSRAELTLQPERSGHYVFTFVAISDANYKKVELNGPSIEQMIHPLASADFSNSPGRGGKKIVSTCSGDSVNIDVDLRGAGPWKIELQIIGPHSANLMQFEGIQTSKKTLEIPIPEELQKSGGSFEIGLVSIEDASGCKRPVSVPGVEVKVKRVVPSVRFYGKPEERNTVVAENERADLPLRLTGDGPWRVTYRRHQSGATMTNTFYDRNANIHVMDQGLYEILSVTDSQCPGNVISDASTYTVEWIPRPSAKLSPSTQAIHDVHNGSYILPPICEGVNDHVDLDLTGRPPFQIMYNIAQNSESGGTKLMGQPIFNSIQPRTRFQLTTTTPGRVYYEVKQIGDAAYPLAKSKDRTIPRRERLLFEQHVSVRPSARFRTSNRLAYCLHDTLVPADSNTSPGDGVVLLEGVPPFTLTLAIKNIAASSTELRTVHVPTHTWKLDVSSYTFSSIGPHLLSIERVSDSSGCEEAAPPADATRAVWADVAESAAIIPIERRTDLCVGDVTAFQLEGIPPWTVGYRINGKAQTQEARTSPFSVAQQQAGDFVVTSVANYHQRMCKAAVADLRFKVHALPSAQVGHGRRIFQDIHEGDQAEIVFTLIGEPPFTFTYQRSELSPKKGVLGKVLETHTISRVQTNEYSIFSALEGTWTVTSISDKYCRYPPVQPELAVEKHK